MNSIAQHTTAILILLMVPVYVQWHHLRKIKKFHTQHTDTENGIKNPDARMQSLFRLHSQAQRLVYVGIFQLAILTFIGWHLSAPTLCALIGATHIGIAAAFLVARDKLRKSMETAQHENAIVSFHIKTDAGETVWMWIKKSPEEWPPVRLDFGVQHVCLPAKETPIALIKVMEDAIRETPRAKDEQEIRDTLQKHNVTHLIDIEGATVSPVIQEFVETLLPQPA